MTDTESRGTNETGGGRGGGLPEVMAKGIPITVVAAKKPGKWIVRGIRCFADVATVKRDVAAVVGTLDDEIEWTTYTYRLPAYLAYGSGDMPRIGWPNGVWLFRCVNPDSHADCYGDAERVGDNLPLAGSVNKPWAEPTPWADPVSGEATR